MARIISASIDLTKIDKARITAHKNGSKYFNIDIMLNDEKDKYENDVSIATAQTKEERETKAKRTWLGNGKTVWTNDKATGEAPITTDSTTDDDLPF